MKNFSKQNKGFTLIELIIVVAIIALLAGATFVAINPAKRIGEANDAQRWSDVTSIASAWALYVADNGGSAPTTTAIAGTTYHIANATGGTHSDANCTATTTTALIEPLALVTSGYLGDIPNDPAGATNVHSGYYFYTNSIGVIKIGACTTSTYAVNPIIVTR